MDNLVRRTFTFTSNSLEEFESKVVRAKSLGATHITISQIEKSRWQWERDLSDPYPNWSMLVTSLFKIIVPDELREWLPVDYADRNLDLIIKRSRILEKYGLKGSFHMKEPAYLPEEVFTEHPEWRGPRCDHPRRAKNHYFSPCIDRDDILAMYEKAMYKLCSAANIEYFHIFTNDSGGGLCWSTGLYTGKNGPEWCRSIPMNKRVGKFLDTLKRGTNKAGVDAWIEINSNIGIKEPEHEMDAMWPFLPDYQAVNKKSNDGRPLAAEVFMNWEYTIQPVKNIARPFDFLEQYEKANASGLPAQLITVDDTDFDVYYRLMDKFNSNPTKGLTDRTVLIRETASDIAGSENADELVDIWAKTEKAVLHFIDTGLEGLVSCAVNQRWINRPFVLFPDELTFEEKDYYRRFQFQANDEAHANDLLDIQNSSFIRGYSGVFLASMALKKAMALLEEASDKARKIKGLELYSDRLMLLSCFMKNSYNAIRFQHIVDTADYERVVEISPEWPLDAEPALLKFEEITRAEIDNTNKIISLIKDREQEMLLMAPTHELEDIFLFSPQLCSQMKLKTRTMINHLLDGKRLFVTHNK
ncbi:MAG TPA: hypothetical protein PLP30_07775 [Clostridia bacterium]|nr:hypothetical protein [Clostridia bacterium]HRX41713.1 hypothetical protein [Clostridia bacterium]